MSRRALYRFVMILIPVLCLCGCELIEGAATVGWETAKFTGKAIKSVAYIAQGKQVIRLQRSGNGLLADVTLNRKIHGLFLVDTGAANVMISQKIARRMRVDFSHSRPTQARLASGKVIPARIVILKELRVGGARVNNIQAIVLLQEAPGGYDGLLGMSFLNNFIFQIDTQKGELILQRRPSP